VEFIKKSKNCPCWKTLYGNFAVFFLTIDGFLLEIPLYNKKRKQCNILILYKEKNPITPPYAKHKENVDERLVVTVREKKRKNNYFYTAEVFCARAKTASLIPQLTRMKR